MYGLDNASGVNVMPKLAPVSSATPLWFTEGGAGLAASYPGQDWFNMVQAEMLGVLTAAGVKPDKSKLNQLAEAIKKIVTDGGYVTSTTFKTELDKKLDTSSVVQSTGTSKTQVISQDAATKLFLKYGDYGWGGSAEDIPALSDTELEAMLKRKSTVTQVFRNTAEDGLYHYKYSTLVYFKSNDTYMALTAGYMGNGIKVIAGNPSSFNVYNLWTDKNFNPSQYVKLSDNTAALALKFDKADVAQGAGTSKTKVISQEAVTYLSLGLNDKYTEMTSQRTLNTTYTNALSKPIFISLYTEDKTSTGIQLEVIVDGNIIARHVVGGDGYTRALTATFIVPPSSTYSITANAAIRRWYELR